MNMKKKILRRRAVEDRTGLSRSTLYQRISEGLFPASISLGGRTVGWIEQEVDEWLERQIKASRERYDAMEQRDGQDDE